MGHGIEKALDIRIKHPVHLLPINPGVESIQRIVLAAPRSESIREAEKILLVDGLQNVHDCLLDDLVLQAQNAQWPLGAVRLRDVCPSGRAGPIAAPMHSLVQVLQFLFERFSIGLPCHAIDAGRSVTREREIAPLQEIGGDVMQQCREPYRLALSRRLAHGCQPVRRGIPAQCPGRGRLTAVPLGRGPSLHGLRRGNALIVRPLHRYYSLVRLLIRVHAHRSAFACMSRSGMPCRTRMRPPRFRAKNFSTCMGSQTARGPPTQAIARVWYCLLFPGTGSAPRNWTRFAARYPAHGLPCERFTAALADRTSCITRGRGGWLDLPRGGLSPPILCQLPGALRVGSEPASRAAKKVGDSRPQPRQIWWRRGNPQLGPVPIQPRPR